MISFPRGLVASARHERSAGESSHDVLQSPRANRTPTKEKRMEPIQIACYTLAGVVLAYAAWTKEADHRVRQQAKARREERQ